MKEKLIKAMQLIETEESYIRNGYSLNDEDAAALAEANDLLHEILSSVNSTQVIHLIKLSNYGKEDFYSR